MGINDVLSDFGRGLMQTNTWQGGIAQGLNNFNERKKKAGLAAAFQSISGQIPERLRPLLSQLEPEQAMQFALPMLTQDPVDAELKAAQRKEALAKAMYFQSMFGDGSQQQATPNGVDPNLFRQAQRAAMMGDKTTADILTAQITGAMPKPPAGYQRVEGGRVAPIPGGPDDPAIKGFSEGQNKANIFASRAAEAEAALQKYGASLQDPVQMAKSQIPLAGNYLVSPDFQNADQAQRNLINSFLRRESGAVISPVEFDSAYKQYIPRPGDNDQVLAQKAENRRTQIETIRAEAGPAYTGMKSSPQKQVVAPTPTVAAPKNKADPLANVATPDAETKVINGVTYTKVNGQWMQ